MIYFIGGYHRMVRDYCGQNDIDPKSVRHITDHYQVQGAVLRDGDRVIWFEDNAEIKWYLDLHDTREDKSGDIYV